MSLTKQQRAARVGAYGASEIASIVGCAPWSGPVDVYAQHVLEAPEDAGADSVPAQLGQLLEEPVAKLYAERTGLFVARVQTLKHPTLALAVATPDRAAFRTKEARGDPRRKLAAEDLAGADRLVEVKTIDEKDRRLYGPPGSDQVPEEKLVQTTWQCGVAGVPLNDLVVLFGRRSWEIFTIPYSADLFGTLYDLVERFDVDHVQARKPPDPDATKAYEQFLKQAYPRALKPELTTSEDQDAEVLNFALLREAARRIKVLLDQKKNRMRLLIGEHEGIRSPVYGLVKYRHSRDQVVIDWRAVAQEATSLAALALNNAGEPALVEQLKTIITRHSVKRPGSRRFLFRPEGPARFELERLNLALDVLDKSSTDSAEESPDEEADH